MELTIKRLDVSTISKEDSWALARILQMGRRTALDTRALTNYLSHWNTFAAFDGTKMAACIQVDPNAKYFGKCFLIISIIPHWQYNREDVIRALILGALKWYGESLNEKYIAIEVDSRHDPFLNLYKSLGFQKSYMAGAVQKSNVVLVTDGSRLLQNG